MLISCPKCNAVYQIPDGKIPAEGKKFKCAECGEVWTVRPQDVKGVKTEEKAAPAPVPSSASVAAAASLPKAESSSPQVKPQIISPQTAQNSDVENMFNRLSQDTKGLFNNNSSSDTRAERWKRRLIMFFSPFMVNCCLLILIFAFTIYIGYTNRFYLVSNIPQLENFYKKMGIHSLLKGRGLVFQNVQSRYVERQGKFFVEVSGLIYNESDMKSLVLPIKAELYNTEGEKLSETIKVLTLDRLEPNFSAVFRILLPDTGLEDKIINLSFDENADI